MKNRISQQKLNTVMLMAKSKLKEWRKFLALCLGKMKYKSPFLDINYKVTYVSPEFKAKWVDVGWFCDCISAKSYLKNGLIWLTKNKDGFKATFKAGTTSEMVASATKWLESFGLKLVPITKQSK